MTHFPGQQWTYRAPVGFEGSRLIIGAVAAWDNDLGNTRRAICCAVANAPRRLPDGTVDAVTIPFLPMSEDAFAASALLADGQRDLPEEFAASFDEWRKDVRGLSVFTVPFEGFLDRMIARQMAEIVGRRAA